MCLNVCVSEVVIVGMQALLNPLYFPRRCGGSVGGTVGRDSEDQCCAL